MAAAAPLSPTASLSASPSTKLHLHDNIGFVECLEVFGSDVTVVNAARVSFHKEVTSMTTADEKLLNYLAKHNHVSPFFHPQVRFRIKMPIFVAREWFRHQIGLSRNEVSRRYVDTPPECWVPAADQIRARDPRLKQGSKSTPVDNYDEVHGQILSVTIAATETYRDLLAKGVAPEVARCILPQSMYTEFIETGSLYAYARICALRLDPTAQAEIRTYAGFVDSLLSAAFPAAWKALQQMFHVAPVATATATAPEPAPVPAIATATATPPPPPPTPIPNTFSSPPPPNANPVILENAVSLNYII
jgi:thymidylate synthase (FAD)